MPYSSLFAAGRGADLPTWVWIVIGVIVVVALVVGWIRESKVLAKQEKVISNGEKVIVWAVSIDPILFGPCQDWTRDYCGPAGVLVPGNPDDGYDVDYMMGLVDKALAFAERRRSPKEDERKIARELKENEYREGIWIKLPKSWLDGDPVYYTLMPIYRDKLPKEKARRNRRFFRAVVDFDHPEEGAVHRKYDPDDQDDGPWDDRPRRKSKRRDDADFDVVE